MAAGTMDILANLLAPVVVADTGEAGVEWVAVGKVANGPDLRASGQLAVDWSWTRAALRDAVRAAARAALAEGYGLPPITAGRFVLIAAL